MSDLSSMVWVEQRKAIRSRMPLWTALASMVIPLSIAFLIFVTRNPEISQKLGLISAKANLVAFAGMDWPAYLGLFGQIIAAGGFILFVMSIAWMFGREFDDGTMKDLLAVPVPRGSIVLAKFIVLAVWCAALTLVMVASGLAMGALLGIPGLSSGVLTRGGLDLLIAAFLTIAVVTPFALLASIGRGYLLPIGMAFMILLLTNLAALIGWGAYFPWAVAGLFAQGETPLSQVSYWIVLLTGLAGILGTTLWWKYADQNR